MDEMWSFVYDKGQPYWLWWAIDHKTGIPRAYCFGSREHKTLEELKGLLEPFKINIIYSIENMRTKSVLLANVTRSISSYLSRLYSTGTDSYSPIIFATPRNICKKPSSLPFQKFARETAVFLRLRILKLRLIVVVCHSSNAATPLIETITIIIIKMLSVILSFIFSPLSLGRLRACLASTSMRRFLINWQKMGKESRQNYEYSTTELERNT